MVNFFLRLENTVKSKDNISIRQHKIEHNRIAIKFKLHGFKNASVLGKDRISNRPGILGAIPVTGIRLVNG